MAIQPQNNGLITENNEQYYAGSQGFRGNAGIPRINYFQQTLIQILY